MLRFQPYASQTIMPCVLLLTAIGTAMIARIDQAADTAVAFRQLIWMSPGVGAVRPAGGCSCATTACCDGSPYVSMVVGLVLLLSSDDPRPGHGDQGARIWINIFGLGTIQPGEFAKLFLAFFFAAYLFDHRDQLAVGGRKFLGLQLPRIKDMGPIIIVWLASMGVLVLQHDLGTSLMFFAMFVSMLYVATGRKSWIIIGVIAFAAGAVLAAQIFAHVGLPASMPWLRPFDQEIYDRYPRGSAQIVSGLFGLASGGLLGTGLGRGTPR